MVRGAAVSAGPATLRRRRVDDQAQRFGRHGHRGRWPVLLAGLAVAVCGALAWLLVGTSVLGVRHVVVTGNHRVSTAQVLRLADVPAGHPLATLDTGAVRRRVATLAPLDSVQVTRQWPTTVRITVVERTPAAVVTTAAGLRLVDAGGVVFAAVPRPPAGLPVVQVAHPGPRDPATKAALAVLAVLPKQVAASVATVEAPGPSDVELRLRDGDTVVWGDASQSARKAVVLKALLHRPGKVYDVSAPDLVTVRG